MKPVRNYKCKDVELLLSAATIIDSAIAKKDFLQSKRSTWKDPFFEDFRNEIDKAIQDHLGQDNAKGLRNATQAVLANQSAALKDLAEVKVQIEEDFKNEPIQKTEILNTLGFTAFHSKTKNKDQEALISLLYQFKTNLTPQLQDTITAKGTAQDLLDKVISHADELKDTNIIQEGKKGTRKELTDDGIIALNNIYDKVISIAKISAKFFKEQPAIQEQFSFSKVKNNLNNTKPKPNPES